MLVNRNIDWLGKNKKRVYILILDSKTLSVFIPVPPFSGARQPVLPDNKQRDRTGDGRTEAHPQEGLQQEDDREHRLQELRGVVGRAEPQDSAAQAGQGWGGAAAAPGTYY